MEKPIPPLDLLWFVMETQAAPTHVGALLIFEKPKGRPEIVREIAAAYRAHDPTPPFNYVPELGGSLRPHFREADSYDPHYHVSHIALPAGATEDDLLRLRYGARATWGEPEKIFRRARAAWRAQRRRRAVSPASPSRAMAPGAGTVEKTPML